MEFQSTAQEETSVVATSESCFVVSVVASSVTISQDSSFAQNQKLNKLNQVLLIRSITRFSVYMLTRSLDVVTYS